MAHEIAGVVVASFIAVVIARAFMPGSQAPAVLSALTDGWSKIIGKIGTAGG